MPSKKGLALVHPKIPNDGFAFVTGTFRWNDTSRAVPRSRDPRVRYVRVGRFGWMSIDDKTMKPLSSLGGAKLEGLVPHHYPRCLGCGCAELRHSEIILRMENADFAGRVAVVTGAWRGLGRAAAARLHERGASVAVNVRHRERAEALAKEIGERAFAVPGDVAADGVPDEIARRTLERFGRIDILVNNAALPLSTRFPDLTAEEWRRVIEVNLTAPFLMTKAVLPAMRAQHYGRIINISSSAGRMVSTLGGAHYTASKAGLLGLTRAAAKELGKFGITVNAICPGMIDTELTREHASDELLERLAASYPVPRLGTAVEVADLICFAASEAAGYITGASFDINGGDLMM